MSKGFLFEYVELGGIRPSRYDGLRKYASTSAVSDGKVHIDQLEQVDYENRPSRANQVASPGDVLFARMEATSKVLAIDESNCDLLFSTGFAVVKPQEGKITTRCLYHLLLSEAFKRAKDGFCTGATQRAITNAGLRKLKIIVPPYECQVEIASRLDYVLQHIESANNLVNMLDNLVKSRFSWEVAA